MKTLRTLFIGIVLCFSATALGVECLNHIAVDGRLLDGDGYAGQSACYFTSHGNSNDAFVRASLLAGALGLKLDWDEANKALVFKQGDRVARYYTTSDIARGLERQPDVFLVDDSPYDGNRALPMAIIVEGTSWVPVTPIAKAFGAELEWHSQAKTIFIDTFEHVAAMDNQHAAPTSSGGMQTIGVPRVGRDRGVTRVAVDVPKGTTYHVAVDNQTLVVTFERVTANQFSFDGQDDNVADLRYVATEDGLALAVDTHYALDKGGKGFRVGLVQREDDEVLYVDFAPHIEGQAVDALTTPVSSGPASETAPAARSSRSGGKAVVLDPGHGGIFGGARSPDGQIREEIVALDIAVRVRSLLEEHGIKVVMTRENNAHLSEAYVRDLQARANLATTDRNMFVSIHANAAANRNAQGIETYLFGEPLSEEVRQQAIRENGGGAVGRAVTDQAIEQANAWTGDLLAQQTLQLSRSLADNVQSSLISKTGALDRGVKQAPFLVLRQARIPAILVEVGFVTHPEEGPRLAQRDYQERLANAIAAGIIDFFERGGTFAGR